MPISLPGPPDYVEYVNSSGITFLVPEQSAPANVPYSLKVLAESIEKDDLHNGDDFYLQVSGANSMTGDLDLGSNSIVDVDSITATGKITAGSAEVTSPAVDDVKTVRNITTSLNEPTPTDGVDGDIWIQYEVD